MAEETIADIVREMREDDGVRMEFPGMVKAVPNIWILKWCDRIEAAAKRDEREADCTNCDYANVVAENERLRAALKPVLSFDIDTHPCDGYCVMLNAVREAQRIAREGGAK